MSCKFVSASAATCLLFGSTVALAQSPAPAPGLLIAQPEIDQSNSSEIPHADSKGRHFAPRGTFYLLSYLSAKTDKGVVGFPPGQKVTYVSANKEKQTLVVSDGREQVEVPAAKLTNDLDVAALVAKKDQASQAQIAAYAQSELEAYNKRQNAVARDNQKEIEKHNDEQAAREQQPVATSLNQPPVDANAVGEGYYNQGGYGYGNPYSYFVGGTTLIAPTNAAPGTPSTPTNPSSGAPNKVGVPGPGGGGRPR